MRRNERSSRAFTVIAACAALLFMALMALSARPAHADDTIKTPGAHAAYDVEIEPHVLLDPGFDAYYGNGDIGIGTGIRFGIPIVSNGFIPSLNNSVAISFGADWLHYPCYFAGNCSADYFDFPVALQWNFYLSEHWSVFGEPGLFIYHGIFSNNECVPGICVHEQDTGVLPAFYAGARYRFSDTVSLTMRVGYPSFSIGVSFFP